MPEMTPRLSGPAVSSSPHTLSGVSAYALISSSCRTLAPSSGSPKLILNQNSEPQTCQGLLRQHREEGLEMGPPHLSPCPHPSDGGSDPHRLQELHLHFHEILGREFWSSGGLRLGRC